MIKITKNNWIPWTSAVVLLAVLELGFATAVDSKGLASGEAAGWMQAIGSVVAILAAGAGISAQLHDVDKRAQQAAREDRKHLLKALAAEAKIIRIAVSDIQEVIENDLNTQMRGLLKIVFPEVMPRFTVYVAAAAKIGLIEDDTLRTEVIALYASVDSLFSQLNRNSALVISMGTDEPDPDTIQRFKGYYRAIIRQLGPVVELAETVCAKLNHAADS